MHADTYMLGVYSEMEESGGQYFAHVLFTRQAKHAYYMKVSFDVGETSVTSYNVDKDMRTKSSFFVSGSAKESVGGFGVNGYLAYLVGWKKKYLTKEGTNYDTRAETASLSTTHSGNANSCYANTASQTTTIASDETASGGVTPS